MYRFLPYPHVAIALLLSLPTILKAQKPLVECPKLLYWDLAEANVSHKIPALKLNGLNMERDGDRQWELHFRTSLGPSTSTYFLDTADSNMTNIGLCSGGLRLMDRNTWQLSKGVIERSLKDNGDCKIMLGEACTEALRQHYEREARMAYMIHGRCLQCEEEPCSIEPSATNAGTPWNDTVPYQCSGLVDGRQEWVSGAGSLWMDAGNFTRDPDAEDCARQYTSEPLEKISIAGQFRGGVAISASFPTPAFFTFFVNMSTETTKYRGIPIVEVACLTPSINDRPKVSEPRPAKEILDDDRYNWHERATDPDDIRNSSARGRKVSFLFLIASFSSVLMF